VAIEHVDTFPLIDSLNEGDETMGME
jgi:hypothetical protein